MWSLEGQFSEIAEMLANRTLGLVNHKGERKFIAIDGDQIVLPAVT